MDSRLANQTDVFWADNFESAGFQMTAQNKYFSRFIITFRVLMQLSIITITVGIIAVFSPVLAGIYLMFMAIIFGSLYFRLRKVKSKYKDAKETQERARQLTGASTIGSAVHVAGHPLLERDQPVVLALIDDHLSIYNYESSQPVDTIPLKDFTSLQTVVYDDERVPHIEVIDSAAQALQINLTKQGQPVTFLLRKMVKVRPIDWYHAIEKARYAANAG